jgi:Na+/H+-dicarboxylate symporter
LPPINSGKLLFQQLHQTRRHRVHPAHQHGRGAAGVCLAAGGNRHACRYSPPWQEKSQPVLNFFDGVNEAMLKLVMIIIEIAPYGVFALIAAMIAEFGLGILSTLAKYSLVVFLGLLIHAGVTYPTLLKIFTRLPIRKFFRRIRPAQLIAFSSSSSSATLPVTIECVEQN